MFSVELRGELDLADAAGVATPLAAAVGAHGHAVGPMALRKRGQPRPAVNSFLLSRRSGP